MQLRKKHKSFGIIFVLRQICLDVKMMEKVNVPMWTTGAIFLDPILLTVVSVLVFKILYWMNLVKILFYNPWWTSATFGYISHAQLFFVYLETKIIIRCFLLIICLKYRMNSIAVEQIFPSQRAACSATTHLCKIWTISSVSVFWNFHRQALKNAVMWFNVTTVSYATWYVSYNYIF